jgi:hypothetical protein
MTTDGNVISLLATDAWVLRKFQRTLGATAQHPRSRKPGTYLGQVCVDADGPVTLRRPTKAGPNAFSITADPKRSLTVGDALMVCR